MEEDPSRQCVRSRGLMPKDPSAYAKVFDGVLTRLQGENARGEPVSGVEFWASAPMGAAGSYSSSAGRRVLAAKIRQLWPAVTLERNSQPGLTVIGHSCSSSNVGKAGIIRLLSLLRHRHFHNCRYTWTSVCIWRGLGRWSWTRRQSR